MKIEIECNVSVPDGYKVVAFRPVRYEEGYLTNGGFFSTWVKERDSSCNYLILEKLVTPKAGEWWLVERKGSKGYSVCYVDEKGYYRLSTKGHPMMYQDGTTPIKRVELDYDEEVS